MSSTVDARYEALGLLGHEGASSDRVRSWLLSQLPEGTEGTISDLWMALFDQDGVAPGARPGRMLWWYQGQGIAANALPDAAFDYWVDTRARTALWDSTL